VVTHRAEGGDKRFLIVVVFVIVIVITAVFDGVVSIEACARAYVFTVVGRVVDTIFSKAR
jgi:hypothetical protein